MPTAVDSIQFAAFAVPGGVGGISGNAAEWWERATGQRPDAFGPTAQNSTMASGQLKAFEFTVQVSPFRADLIASAPAAPVGSDWQLIQDFEGALEVGRDLAESLFHAQALSRLGLVVQRSYAATDTANAVSIISGKIPGLVAPAHASDLQYQVNVRTSSKVIDGLEINRLLRWQSVMRALFNVGANGLPAQAGSPMPAVNEYIDVNTLATLGRIPLDKLSVLLTELCGIAREMVSDGYAALER